MRRIVPYLIFSAVFLIPLTENLSAQTLTFYEIQKDGVGGVNGLDGAYGVCVSPDDQHVYGASSTDDGVAVFAQAGAGGLSYVEAHIDDGAGGTVPGLNGAKRLCIAPDGGHIYVPSSTDDALVVFSRNSTTGALTYVETHVEGFGGVSGMSGAFHAVVSPDNEHVYVASSSSDAVAVFDRNTTTGELSFIEAHLDGVSGVDGLNSARSLAISSDGAYLYCAGSIDDAIAIFARNTTTGALTFDSMVQDGSGGVDGLNGVYGIVISPDDNHLYAVGSSDDAVAVFSRDGATGLLTYEEVHKDDSQGGSITYLNAARAIDVSANGKFVYACSSTDDGLVVFARNTTDGLLSLDEEHTDGVGGIDGLEGSRMIAATGTSANIYVASSTDDAIAVFDNVVVLPIELTEFSAEYIEASAAVDLNWVTVAEINNDFFTVERSETGRDFQPIAEVQGAGNSAAKIEYNTLDDRPLQRINYYRLKQTDFDGQFEYSDVVAVEVPTKRSVPERGFQVYPNPAVDGQEVYLQLSGFEQQEVLVTVQDVYGQLLYSKVLVTGAFGEESVFAVDQNNQLAPGTYFVTGSADDNLFSKKLIVK